MSEPTKYGIIGCGMMGQEHLRNIALLPNTQVAAIFEPNAQMQADSAKFAPDAQFVDSVQALLAVDGLDCIMIASPNFRHVEQLEALAAQNPLPVLVEKPLFTSIDDLKRVEDFAANYPAPVWVAMEYRYMPPIAAFLEEAETVTGGIKMLTVREHRFPFLEKVDDWNRFNVQSGGTFVEKCCHFFDLMRLTLKSEPVRVMASGGQDVNHLDERYDGETPDILDNGYVIVEFASGARAMLELCMFAEGAEYQEDVSAVGPNGKAEAFVPGPGRFWPEHLGAAPVPKLVISPRDPKGPEERDIPVDPTILEAGDHNGSTFYQHQKFLELVRGERDAAEVSLHDGKMAVLMGLAAQISIAENRMVEMSELA
ncbi:gfo/Idh/MocA family oxidoreductase [Epibacterium sp. SM1979]|uniref:Gfo/Idh/MocA family oxidoreductase n=1 Tax=Tritonibacter litoralis TaxID=2662264 RepID=A0A843YLM4_9RHOB|nr:Gfo/Idh/MocA family oxidoreductase [Tritonibacter litoralis]MQQ10152.1 gfo/Idh/MocA family oxidoreductase [Tritonibacter litoralis]